MKLYMAFYQLLRSKSSVLLSFVLVIDSIGPTVIWVVSRGYRVEISYLEQIDGRRLCKVVDLFNKCRFCM